MTKSFSETHRPRHAGLEQLRGVRIAAPTPLERRPSNYITMYLSGDARVIYVDAENRPQHYSSRQHDMLEGLARGENSYSDRDLNDLFLTYLQQTDAAARSKNLAASITDARHGGDDGILLDDGRTTQQAAADEKASFEAQDFGPSIVII